MPPWSGATPGSASIVYEQVANLLLVAAQRRHDCWRIVEDLSRLIQVLPHFLRVVLPRRFGWPPRQSTPGQQRIDGSKFADMLRHRSHRFGVDTQFDRGRFEQSPEQSQRWLNGRGRRFCDCVPNGLDNQGEHDRLPVQYCNPFPIIHIPLETLEEVLNSLNRETSVSLQVFLIDSEGAGP